jgi:hypothetical protein
MKYVIVFLVRYFGPPLIRSSRIRPPISIIVHPCHETGFIGKRSPSLHSSHCLFIFLVVFEVFWRIRWEDVPDIHGKSADLFACVFVRLFECCRIEVPTCLSVLIRCLLALYGIFICLRCFGINAEFVLVLLVSSFFAEYIFETSSRLSKVHRTPAATVSPNLTEDSPTLWSSLVGPHENI